MSKPKLIVQGGSDQLGGAPECNALFATLPEPKRLVIVEGADHFFTGQLDQMTAAIDTWLGERNPDRLRAIRSHQKRFLTVRLKQLQELIAGSGFDAYNLQIGVHVLDAAHAHQCGGDSGNRPRELQRPRSIVLQTKAAPI